MDRAQLLKVWEIGRTLREENHADVIGVLAPYLDDQQLDEAEATLTKMSHGVSSADQRARAWAVLARYLKGASRSAALAEAVKAVSDPDNRMTFVRTLPVLLPQLQQKERTDVSSMVLQHAFSIVEDDRRAETLTSLAPCLSEPDQRAAIERILESCTGTRVVMTVGGTRIRHGIEREFLLHQIESLAGTLADMSGEPVVAEIVTAIQDTGRAGDVPHRHSQSRALRAGYQRASPTRKGEKAAGDR